MRRFAVTIFLSFTLLGGCSSPDEASPVQLVLKDGAPPASWDAGDRVKIEGKLAKSDGEPYLLEFTVGKGELARRHCAVIRGIDDLGWASRWKAQWLANGDTNISVTGVTLDERHPKFRSVEIAGEGAYRTCTFAMQVEKIWGL